MKSIIKSPLIIEDQYLSHPFLLGADESLITLNNMVAMEAPSAEEDAQEVTASIHQPPMPNNKNDAIRELSEKDYFDSEPFKRKLAELERSSEEKGYEKGFQMGESEAKVKCSETIEMFNQLVANGESSVLDVIDDAKELIGAIVFEATCKILGEHLVAPNACYEMVSKVVASVKKDEIISVRVSPEDYRKLQLLKEQSNSDFSLDVVNLPIVADTTVKLGGCVLKLKDGLVDGTLEMQLRKFAQSLRDFNLKLRQN